MSIFLANKHIPIYNLTPLPPLLQKQVRFPVCTAHTVVVASTLFEAKLYSSFYWVWRFATVLQPILHAARSRQAAFIIFIEIQKGKRTVVCLPDHVQYVWASRERKREKRAGQKGYLIAHKDAKRLLAAFPFGGRDEQSTLEWSSTWSGRVELEKTQVYAVGHRRGTPVTQHKERRTTKFLVQNKNPSQLEAEFF